MEEVKPIENEVKPEPKMNFTNFEENQTKRFEEAVEFYKKSNHYKEKIIVGVSGHRFDKNLRKVARKIGTDYLAVNKDRIEYVITGGATGWDLIILKQCHKLDIPYKIYLAFKEDMKRLPPYIKDNAIEITWEKNKFKSGKDKRHYMGRNIKIVNDSDELQVFVKKPTGGTINTIQYAINSTNKFIFNWELEMKQKLLKGSQPKE
jgi:hypothetical protein